MLALKGTWWKPVTGNSRGTPTDVIVRAFSHASMSEGQGSTEKVIRPVAVIQDIKSGALRYVEVKYVEIKGELNGAH